MKKILGWAILFLAALIFANPAQSREPVEIFTGIDKVKFIGGQNIVLKVDIVFYQQVNPFWEEFAKINFSPFKLEKFVLSEKKMFDKEKDLSRDFRQAAFLLSLPDSSDCGLYAIPSFSLNYSYFKDKREIKGRTKSMAVKVEKVPILINYDLEKDAMAIGEINTLRINIWREKYIRVLNYELESAKNTADITKEDFRRWLKSLETRNKKITDLDKPAFGKFRILSFSKKSEPGNIQKDIFEYRFSFYENPTSIPTPDFHIWYMNEKEKEQPKEIVIPPQTMIINSSINPNRRSIEWIKEPKRYPEKNIYYFGYGPLALGGILLIVFGTSALAGTIMNRKKCDVSAEICESVSEIWNGLLKFDTDHVPADNQARALLLRGIRNEFSKAMGGILGIPTNRAKAKTAPEIAETLRENGFSEDVSEKIKYCFQKIDQSVQNCAPGHGAPAIRETMDRIREIADAPEIAKFLKKRKKI